MSIFNPISALVKKWRGEDEEVSKNKNKPRPVLMENCQKMPNIDDAAIALYEHIVNDDRPNWFEFVGVSGKDLEVHVNTKNHGHVPKKWYGFDVKVIEPKKSKYYFPMIVDD